MEDILVVATGETGQSVHGIFLSFLTAVYEFTIISVNKIQLKKLNFPSLP